MALPLPNLDDHTYADLVQKAISQISVEFPEWTDHNPTDTGIILIELLAWLTEMTLYRVNQVPDENYASFLSLLKGEQWNLPINLSSQEQQEILQAEIQKTLLELRKTYRAITPADFEQLVLVDWNQSPESEGLKIARVNCLAQCNLESNDQQFAQGHISLVVVTENNQTNHQYGGLFTFLEPRKLLTTRLHIVEPNYISITLEVELVITDGAQAEDVKEQAKTEVKIFFNPLQSGNYWQGKGWPFGRSVHLSELYKLFDDLPGVDYVNNLQLKNQENISQSEIYLAEHQLVNLNITDSTFTVLVEVDNEQKKI